MPSSHTNAGAMLADPLRRAGLILLWRTPMLLPLVAVVGVVLGGSEGWVLVVVALALAHILRLRRIFLCCLLCGLVVATTQSIRREQAAELLRLADEHSAITLQGTVVAELNRGCILETGLCGARVAVRGEMPWRVADEVRITAASLPVDDPLVEGMFSATKWMRENGLAANLEYESGEKIGTSIGWSRLVRVSAAMRAALADLLMPAGTEDDMRRQVLCALVLGEKDRSDYETMEIFRRSGCLHAFAVSGLHVGLVAGLMWALLRVCHVRPAIGRVLMLLCVGVYVVATGMAPPAIRAYVMLAALLGGVALKRRSSLFNIWCCAALLILMVEPWQLYRVGFQLSFVVYAAICIGMHYSMKERPWFGPDSYIPARIYTRAERFAVWVERCVRGAVVVALSAWLVSVPFAISQFHAVNAVSYLTNIAITPLLPVVMLCGLSALLLGQLPLLGGLCHYMAVQSAGWLVALVSFTGSVPDAYLPAHDAAPPKGYMVASLRYGKSFCVLGNPGLLLGDMSRAEDVRYRVQPALFHAGYTPVLVAGDRAIAEEPLSLLQGSWPQLRVISPQAGVAQRSFSTAAGEFHLFYPPQSAADTPPIVIWNRAGGGRVAYIGNAAVSTLENMPPTERRADVIILGYNAKEPLLEPDMLRSMGAGVVVLLPSALPWPVTEQELAPMRVVRFTPESSVQVYRQQ